MEKRTVLDLFCGCGGMSWGLQQQGFHVVAGIDNSKPALDTFQLNHPTAKAILQDITQSVPSEIMELWNGRLRLFCQIIESKCVCFFENISPLNDQLKG